MSDITGQTQYDRLCQDWRQVHNIMWAIPTLAVTIITGIIFAAYQLEDIPRITALGLGSILLFALTVEIIKKRLLMNAISARIYQMEKNPFPFDTKGLLDEVDDGFKKIQKSDQSVSNPDSNDPVYRLFKWSYARQYLGHVVFAAAILTSILTYWEFIKYENYEFWAYCVGFSPVVIVSVSFVIVRLDLINKLKKKMKFNLRK
jgi:hypothetical protein